MSMFGKDNYKALYEGSQQQLAMVERSLDALKKEASSYKDSIEAHAMELSNINAKHSVEVEQYKLALSKKEKSVNARINAKLAQMGVETFAKETISTQEAVTPKQAMDKFQTLTGQAKTEYFRKHQEQITQALHVEE